MPDTQISGPMVDAALDASGHRNTDYNKIWMRAALEAALSGCVVVPREPTEAMNFAGSQIGDYPWDGKKPSRIYRAMIKAAPPVQGMEGG